VVKIVRVLVSGVLALAVPAVLVPPAAAAGPVQITISADSDEGPVRAELLGANHRFSGLGYGMWDPVADAPRPEAVEATRRAGVKMIRYPGGTVANTFHWKRAIGPQTQRGCQTDGRDWTRADSTYGPMEHMRFVSQVGAQAQIMVPFAVMTPANAADWVEFMNAKVGTNPNGGTAWAQVRADHGHPEPYGVRYWELGNEHYLRGLQRYWMDQDPAKAVDQYIKGATVQIPAEPLGKDCAHPDGGVAASGAAGEVFEVKYAPVVTASVRVTVDGVQWRRVDDLAQAGPNEAVFVVDGSQDGHVRFGDGVHGRKLPAGGRVSASYQSVHSGFPAFYQAMKQVDPAIQVCSSWGTVVFPKRMKALGHADDYDCLAAHPYTNFAAEKDANGNPRDSWSTPLDGHDQHMMGAWTKVEQVQALKIAITANGSNAYLAFSEFGALWGPDPGRPTPYYRWNTSMTHALYMASQWVRWLYHDIRFAEGNDLFTTPVRYGLFFGAKPVFTSEAVTREVVKPLFEAGGRRLSRTISGNPIRVVDPANCGNGNDGCYEALVVAATRGSDGRTYVMVVNRLPGNGDAVTARVTFTAGFAAATAHLRATRSSDFTSYNDEAVTGVTMETASLPVTGSGFTHTFPPHSVTLFQLD
jgi:alpha-L-arabinofuranosidase